MSPSRLAVILGPLIALVLIGGLVVTVVRDPGRTELAEGPGDEAASEPASSEPADVVTPAVTPSETASASPTATPSAAAPVPSDAATPSADSSPAAQPGVGAQVAVEDPTALTGGWQGGTPHTGTAVSGMGLLLLLVGGAMLWLRRARG